MLEEPSTYAAAFPQAPYPAAASTSPGATVAGSDDVAAVQSAEFDAMKRSFDSTSISGGTGDKKARYAAVVAGNASSNGVAANGANGHAHLQPHQVYATPANGYAEVYPGAGYVDQNAMMGMGVGVYGFNAGAAAAPFVPQAQQQAVVAAAAAAAQQQAQSHSSQGGYSGPGSPYAAVASPQLGYGSPSSPQPNANVQLPPQSPQQSHQTYSANGYANGNGAGAYDTMPSSPNPYSSGNPYAAGFGGYMGSPQAAFLNMNMLGMGMIGSPQMPGSPMPMQQGVAGYGGMGTANGYQVSGNGQQQSLNGNGSTPQTGRTVYVGNLPSDASVDELLNLVRFGPIDSVKILPEKSCAFISFLDPTTADAFHSDALMRKIRLHDQDLKIGWGKPSSVPANIVMAVQQSGATRNVYLGNLDETITEQSLRDDLSRFGPIDQVKIVRDRAIAFVHFLSIATAIKVVAALAQEPEWEGKKVNYGKDRCAYVPKNQHQQQQHNMAAAAMGSLAASYGGYGAIGGFTSPGFGGFAGEQGMPMSPADPNAQPGNRTIYLGNIHPETTTEEICNTIRGGILQQIRYIPDKHICFVTFVDAQCALAFYQTATYQGLSLHNRRLKIGWGKNSGPTPPGIAMVVQSGGSRNVYVGNIEDFDEFSEERLKKDFGEYGDIELVNSLPSKNASFVNFTNIANAIKAIEGMKQHADYTGFRISYGKDRCGGSPKAGFFKNARGNGAHNASFPEANGSPTFTDGLGLTGSIDAFDPTSPNEEPYVDESVPTGAVAPLAAENEHGDQ
ncbi:differentiation regulator, Nrd1 [Pseudohyphozyma bogoriensis]|nr:differentiation regulator, Nrd1 [Pseudohyphozyma bogoriensis]